MDIPVYLSYVEEIALFSAVSREDEVWYIGDRNEEFVIRIQNGHGNGWPSDERQKPVPGGSENISPDPESIRYIRADVVESREINKEHIFWTTTTGEFSEANRGSKQPVADESEYDWIIGHRMNDWIIWRRMEYSDLIVKHDIPSGYTAEFQIGNALLKVLKLNAQNKNTTREHITLEMLKQKAKEESANGKPLNFETPKVYVHLETSTHYFLIHSLPSGIPPKLLTGDTEKARDMKQALLFYRDLKNVHEQIEIARKRMMKWGAKGVSGVDGHDIYDERFRVMAYDDEEIKRVMEDLEKEIVTTPSKEKRQSTDWRADPGRLLARLRRDNSGKALLRSNRLSKVKSVFAHNDLQDWKIYLIIGSDRQKAIFITGWERAGFVPVNWGGVNLPPAFGGVGGDRGSVKQEEQWIERMKRLGLL